MKAKYILRGLGLGMIITAVVMGAYTKSAVADARVEVLKEYGLGEEAKLAETLVDVGNSEDKDEESTLQNTEPVVVQSEEIPETVVSSLPDAAEGEQQESKEAVSEVDQNNQDVEPQEAGEVIDGQNTVTIEISRGDDSGTVARKLYNAGLVESAAEYDAFLMQHGYDKKLNTGVKLIDANDSWQDIAEKLTKK